ncbi:hypothetical protein FPV67DRAFT_1448524 [Lyophyllum atratum]|nr:hypothetical protein FPV67DRAFT_1448524 [Lyophyllum atratum]
MYSGLGGAAGYSPTRSLFSAFLVRRVLIESHTAPISELFARSPHPRRRDELVAAVEAHKRVLVEDHLRRLFCITGLAQTHRNQGRFDEAEKLYVAVLETSEAAT